MNDTDRELLIRIDEKTKQMHKAMFGNGQPGLCKRVDIMETKMEVASSLKARMPRIVAVWFAGISLTISILALTGVIG